MAIVTPTSSMSGEFTNANVIALFLKASDGTTSLGSLMGGAASDFVKIGLIQDADLTKETTITEREAENSKLPVKIIGQKKNISIAVNPMVRTNAVLSCYYGYIANYNAGNIDVPDDRIDFTGEAFLVYLDEDLTWDNVSNLGHHGMEYWKSVRIIGTGGQTFDKNGNQVYPFEIRLQRDDSGKSLRAIPANDASGIDVTEEYVDFSAYTA